MSISAQQNGFELENRIHNLIKFLYPDSECRKEQDIRNMFDKTFNGIDHWFTINGIHFFIQDKWEEIGAPQGKATQFESCSNRIIQELLKTNENLKYYRIWASKMPPTSNATSTLDNIDTIYVHGKTQMGIALDVAVIINNRIGDYTSENNTVIPILYDDTIEGKHEIEEIKKIINTIYSNYFQKIINMSSSYLSSASLHTMFYKYSQEFNSFNNFQKYQINLKEFISIFKKPCYSEKNTKESFMFYIKMVKIINTGDLMGLLNNFNDKCKELNKKGSVFVKQLSEIKYYSELHDENILSERIKKCTNYTIYDIYYFNNNYYYI